MPKKNGRKRVHCMKIGLTLPLEDARLHFSPGCKTECGRETYEECRRGGRRDEEEADVEGEEQGNQKEGGARDDSSPI